MKKTSTKRLALGRETVKTMMAELSMGDLRTAQGGMTSSSSSLITMSPGPSYSGCPTAASCEACPC